uniref:G_PROTEIN_RECEP_F1_2 domain-containing protein n=1 Tax=Rhabditophanes sp. KR3021 TaxID=114890 RepID=A0AC35UFC5_9BILA
MSHIGCYKAKSKDNNLKLHCAGSFSLSMFSAFKTEGKVNATVAVTFFQFIFNCIMACGGFIIRMQMIFIDNLYAINLVYWNSENVPFPLYISLGCLYFTIYYYNFFFVCLNTVFRYLHVTGLFQVSLKDLVLVFLFSICGVTLMNVNLYYFGIKRDADPHIIYNTNLRNNFTDIFSNAETVNFSFDFNGWGFVITIVPIFIYLIMIYATIFYSLIKYRKFMNTQKNSMSPKALQLNADFYKVLCIQALLPVLFEFTPIIILLCSIASNFANPNMGTYCTLISSIIPSCNSIYFLVTLTKSRRILKERYTRFMNLFLTNKITITRNINGSTK